MRRAVIFVTLVSLIIVVAGVSAAQDGVFDPGQQETTVPEATTSEPTVTQPAEPTMEEALPDGPEETRAERRESDGTYDGGPEDESGQPEEAGRADERDGGEHGNGVSEGPGDEESGGEKVTVCHKGKSLSVGAPAEPAHLRHGDTSGRC